MKSLWIGFGLLVAAGSVSGDTVVQLVSRASEVNPAHRILVAVYELSALQYESDLRTANTADEIVAAELSHLSALSSYRNSLSAYNSDVIDAVFDMGVASIDLHAAEITRVIAETDLAYSRARHNSGAISSSDLADAELDYREETNSYAQAVFDEEEARIILQSVTGITWNIALLPEEPGPPVFADLLVWVEADLSYQQALLNQSTAVRAADNPPGTVSEHDQRSAEIDLDSKTLNVRLAQEAAEREYRRILRTLEANRISMEVQRDRHALQENLLSVAEIRLEGGLISVSQRNQQRVQTLRTEISYLESLRRYTKEIVAHAVVHGEPLDGI